MPDLLPTPTPRIRLRPLRPDDAEACLAVFGDPAVVALDDLEPMTREQVEADLADPRSPLEVWEGELELAIEHDGAMVGVLTLRIEPDAVWLGYHLQVRAHGRGLATEAVSSAVPWAVGRFARAIYAAVHVDNRASVRVLEKCGFVKVGERTVTAKGRTELETVFTWRGPPAPTAP